MEHILSRYEKIFNEDNTIKEIFISVKFFEGDGEFVWEQGYWLTIEERDSVISDEQNLSPIVDKIAIMGEDALIAYRLAPPIEEIELPIEEIEPPLKE